VIVPIKGLIFDGFSTLFTAPDLFPDHQVAKLMWRQGIHVTPQQVRQAMGGEIWERAELGKISDFDRWEVILQNLGLAIGEIKDQLIYECILLEAEQVMRTCRPMPAMRETLTTLQNDHGLRIGICTNASPIHLALEDCLDLRRLVFPSDAFVASCEVGTNKVNLEMFTLMIFRIGLTASECLYVDDGVQHLKTALSLGMTPVLAQTTPEARIRVDVHRARIEIAGLHVINDLSDIIAKVLPECGVST
jgi:HAD superfamily hydrolase (TIGR01509 family)